MLINDESSHCISYSYTTYCLTTCDGRVIAAEQKVLAASVLLTQIRTFPEMCMFLVATATSCAILNIRKYMYCKHCNTVLS